MSGLRYGSVCSGIEAATVAWHPLGWRPQFFSEIEPFPSAVLAHHYPDVPNLGDMTRFKDWPGADIDVLVGGTPCQSFSVAGLRKGLADPRGNLALVYLAIADRYRPEWLVWENVPGVLSSNGGRDFGAFLGGLGELGYGFAYRVLDAQYVRVDGFGRAVPQRRRRVFVVGNSRSWARAAAVLFDPESLSWNSAPRREARETSPGSIIDGSDGCCAVSGCGRSARKRGWCNTHYQRWRKHGFVADTPVNEPGRSDSDRFWEKVQKGDGCWEWQAGLNEKGYGIFWSNDEDRSVRAHRFAYERVNGEIAEGLELDHLCRNRKCVRPDHLEAVTGAENTRRGNAGKHWAEKRGEVADVAPTISSRPTGGSGLGTDFDCDGGLITSTGDVSHCLNAGGMGRIDYESETMIALAFDTTQITSLANRSNPRPGDPCHPLAAGDHAPAIATSWAVRRLTPRECERLQGFPDDYTLIPYRGKPAADGPRYKALGNSMACNVMRWIGTRIDLVESSLSSRENAA